MASLASHNSAPAWSTETNGGRGNPFTVQSERSLRRGNSGAGLSSFFSSGGASNVPSGIPESLDVTPAPIKGFSANEHYQEQLIKCKTGVMVVNRKILATQKIVENIGTRKDSHENERETE